MGELSSSFADRGRSNADCSHSLFWLLAFWKRFPEGCSFEFAFAFWCGGRKLTGISVSASFWVQMAFFWWEFLFLHDPHSFSKLLAKRRSHFLRFHNFFWFNWSILRFLPFIALILHPNDSFEVSFPFLAFFFASESVRIPRYHPQIHSRSWFLCHLSCSVCIFVPTACHVIFSASWVLHWLFYFHCFPCLFVFFFIHSQNSKISSQDGRSIFVPTVDVIIASWLSVLRWIIFFLPVFLTIFAFFFN